MRQYKLYLRNKTNNQPHNQLEVLPKYQNRGYASELIDFAKSFNMPIKAIGRNDSKDFFLHHGFTDVEAKNIEGHDVLLWKP